MLRRRQPADEADGNDSLPHRRVHGDCLTASGTSHVPMTFRALIFLASDRTCEAARPLEGRAVAHNAPVR
jgi:hypothetical protein